MIFDSHCHLDPRNYGGDAGVDAVVETARAAGVTRMLNVGAGYGDGSAQRALAVADRHEGIWVSVGLHPHDAKLFSESVHETLLAMSEHSKVVAWGECGLDFFYDHSPRDQQRLAFRRQIETALRLGLPLIIHDRDSAGETLAILDEQGAFDGRVLYHCFAGDAEQMEALVQRGALISIPGVVTYKKAADMHEVVRRVPAGHYLVETDAPFLTPEPLRGRRNEPCHAALTVEAIARLRGSTPADVARETWDNATAFFGL
ncbi:MAG TPA: TatD family hydrolase [Myxococcota bacterium]|nr:TatD family hydrolase [Myxococcota bacterium]